MRKVIYSLALLAACSLSSCCSLKQTGVDNLYKTQDLINAKYLNYIDNDPKLDTEEGRKKRLDAHDLVQSENDLRAALKK